MRVRIHLNLASPELAENVIKVQSPQGGWVTVAYADLVVLNNVTPVVNLNLQSKVSRGLIKKVPHAFLEGELVSFHGRWRDKASLSLRKLVASCQSAKHKQSTSSSLVSASGSQGTLIGYNPRFAKCFYAHQADRQQINQQFVNAEQVIAVGWAFFGRGANWQPMVSSDYCSPVALSHTSTFEKQAMQQGHHQTDRLIGKIKLK